MLQQTIVFLIVLAAACWAAWYWMPAGWRQAMARALARGGRRIGLREAGAERMARAVADAPGCTSCDSCGSCAAPGKPAVVEPPEHGPRTFRIFPER